MKSDLAIEKIDQQYDGIITKDQSIAHQLSKPIKAIKAGYHEKSIFLCGNILRFILVEICHKEIDKEKIDIQDIKKLRDTAQNKVEDKLIFGYFSEIIDSTESVGSGEHLKMELAHEVLRKLLSIVMWYLENYSERQKKIKVFSKKATVYVFAIFLAFSIILNFGIHSALNNSNDSKPIISFEKDNFKKATEPYYSHFLKKPEDSAGWLSSGLYHYHTGNLNAAIYSYSNAIKMETDYIGYAGRAKAYHAKGFNKNALNDCDKSIQLKPRNKYVYALKGEILEEEGKLKEAEDCYLKACRFGKSSACESYEKLTGKKAAKGNEDDSSIRLW